MTDKYQRASPLAPYHRLYEMSKEEPLRKMGNYGIAVDDFIKKTLGQESYYDREAREENERYWNDYSKNAGIDREDIRYPNKVGESWNSPIQTLPNMAVTGTKRAINMLYGGQE